ncbi:MAG: phosphoglucomutase/phosphomannomutase family protein [Candidatus Omnitrophica bacterium]|nr:phosphoglucomutase/phosphomannomutase family protein [Candidatus Omnitrophota bacterium]
MCENIKNEIKFGTDGWRAIISKEFTFKNVEILSQAISEWINRGLKKKPGIRKRVAIGYDTRFLSDQYARTVACVLAKNNIEVYLSDAPIPTPTLSFGVTRKNCVAGLMITASHNPAAFNGVKIKTAQGGAASREITDIVEEYLCKTEVKIIDFETARNKKDLIVYDFKEDYINFLRNYIDLKTIKKSRYKVLTDAMHGSGDSLILDVLKGTNIRAEVMRGDINPSFEGGKPEPVEEYVSELMSRVKKEKFDLGLILDGDADRIAAVTSDGEYISPQKILGLIILHLVRNKGRSGGVVKTICGTTMLDNIAKGLGLKLYETPVGFKYISDLMTAEDIVAGGEEAGGIGVQNYIPERDGTLAGLLLLEMMVYCKKSIKKLIQDMEKEFGRYYYQKAGLKTDKKTFDLKKVKSMKKILGKKVIDVKTFDGVKLVCEDESWIMFRPSGTEPLVRSYVEAKSMTKAKALIEYGKTVLKKL